MPETAYDITQPYLGIVKKYRPKPNEVDPETQRKIAKGNAVAEAFRLLLDYSGAKKGANVQQRDEPSNAIMSAVDKYYKSKDQNRAEQGAWDQLEMGTEIDSLRAKAQQDYTSQKQKESQDFAKEQADIAREHSTEEKQKDRDLRREEIKNRADEFRASMGLDEEELAQRKTEKETEAAIEREKLSASNDDNSFKKAFTSGSFKGFSITDETVGRTFGLPENSIPQALAFMQEDPNMQEEIGMIKARYNNLGSTAEVNTLMASAFKKLTPQTQDKIWALSSGSIPFTPKSQTTTSQPQTPTIIPDKGSKTMLTVEQPAQEQQSESGLTPEEKQTIVKIQGDTKLETKDKASYINKYLQRQGFSEAEAIAFVERLYPELTRK